jgi:hypothetical protein
MKEIDYSYFVQRLELPNIDAAVHLSCEPEHDADGGVSSDHINGLPWVAPPPSTHALCGIAANGQLRRSTLRCAHPVFANWSVERAAATHESLSDLPAIATVPKAPMPKLT